MNELHLDAEEHLMPESSPTDDAPDAPTVSHLVEHAQRELERAGLFDITADYGGLIANAVMELVNVLSKQGHSGTSAVMTLFVFNQVAQFKPLTPITRNPDEWMEVTYPIPPSPLWQSKRQASVFSNDAGKTWYDIDALDFEDTHEWIEEHQRWELKQ